MKKSIRWNIAQKLELLWWQRYLKDKDKQEYFLWKKRYWNDLLDSIKTSLPFKTTDRILDAGSGPAGIFIILDNYNVDAADPLLDLYEKTIPTFRKKDFPNVNFITTSLEELHTKNRYAIIFCMNAINHVKDINASMENLKKHMAEGGFLVLSIDAHNHTFFKYLFRLIPGDALHPQQYGLEEYISLMEKYGFTFVEKLKLKSEFFFDHWVLIGKK